MTSRERFLAAMNFEPFDRLPVMEWATWWDKTLERWYGEGLPEGMDAIELRRYFGQDVHAQDWLHPQFGDFPKPAHHGAGVMKTEKEYNEIIRPNLFAEPEENWDAKGGFIISCDHQTPPGVSLEAYRLYNKLFHEYAEKAGNLPL